MNKELPIYKLQINDNDNASGVEYVALVDQPAIGVDWMAFAQEKPIRFAVQDEAQRIISGPLMIPDKPIFRKADGEHPDHYVVFEADTVKQVCLKFFRRGNTSNVNLMHDDKAVPDGVYMFESFITDPERGIMAPAQFKDLPEGTWFGSYKVDNAAVWDDFISTGVFKGFSVEGFFSYGPTAGEVQMQEEEQRAGNILKQLEELFQ